ncbi:MAG: 30S ribosomal protein S3 [bacterium]
MGQKISATAMRLGIKGTWKSLWYAKGQNYTDQLHQDIAIREYMTKKLSSAGLEKVEISRSMNDVTVNAYVARPGVAIGRGGKGIDEIKKELTKKYKVPIEIKINELKKANLSARVIARSIADGIEKRMAPKKLMETEKEKAVQAGAKGVKIMISGRIGGSDIARSIKAQEGPVPLQTLRADIDFAEEVAATTNAGLYGVKVWVYREDEKESDKSNRSE